jgi:hypothetical protein
METTGLVNRVFYKKYAVDGSIESHDELFDDAFSRMDDKPDVDHFFCRCSISLATRKNGGIQLR